MADISLRDFIHRKALENSNALEVPDPAFINEVFKCVFCLETPGRRSIPLHFCQSAEHPVCNLCVTAFMKAIEEPEETLICSAVEVDGGFCGGSISFGEKDEAETGVFSCTDILMSKWKGPKLEASLFAKQLLPNHTLAEFEVGFRNGVGSAPPDEKWVPLLRGIYIDYGGDDLCMLMVDENKTHIRVWLSEIDPDVEKKPPGYEICITAPFTPKALPKVTYEYVTDILPYVATGSDGTTGQDDVDDAPGYFELNKGFIKRAQVKDHKDGSLSFTILIKFKKILPTGGEVQDDAVTNQLGVAPEAMKEPVRPEEKEAVAPEAKKEPVRPEEKEAVAPEAKKEPARPEEKEAVAPEAKKEPVRLEEKEAVQETASPEVPKPMAKEGKEALRVNKLVVTKILRKLPDEGKQEEQKDEQKMEQQAEGGKKEEQKDEQKMEQQAEGGKKEDQKDEQQKEVQKEEQKKVEQKEGGQKEEQKKEHKMEDRKEGGKKEEHISRKMRERDPVMSKILYYKRVGATNELVPIPEPTRAEYYLEAEPEPPRSTRRESSGTILILTPPAALLGQIPNIPAAAAAQPAQSPSGKTSPAPPPEERKRRRATPAAAHSRLASGMTYNAMIPDAKEHTDKLNK